MAKNRNAVRTSSLKIKPEKLAPPGVEGYLICLEKLRGDDRTDKEQLRDKDEREFEVKCALGKYFAVPEEIQCSIPNGYGESYLLMPKEEKESVLKTAQGEYHLFKNLNNEISMIAFNCRAHSWQESFDKFYLGIAPFLDHLAYLADIPIVVQKIYCRDKKNNLSVASYATPYPEVKLEPHSGEMREEFLPFYALFREAKNSFSSYYRFLCYYKIMEGIFGYLRPKLMLEARRQNIKIVTQKELVPSHRELDYFQKQYVGMQIKTLFDNELTQEYRNTVAHFVVKNSPILNPSNFYMTVKFADIILLSELCARETLRIQLDYHIQFYKGGGIL